MKIQIKINNIQHSFNYNSLDQAQQFLNSEHLQQVLDIVELAEKLGYRGSEITPILDFFMYHRSEIAEVLGVNNQDKQNDDSNPVEDQIYIQGIVTYDDPNPIPAEYKNYAD